MVDKKDLDDLVLDTTDFDDEERCAHSKITPYGDGTYGRCTKCGDDTFPLVDEGDPEFPKDGKVVFVLQPEHREELLERLRARTRR